MRKFKQGMILLGFISIGIPKTNGCFLSDKNYLGLGSNLKLDSVVHSGSTNTITRYKYYNDSIILESSDFVVSKIDLNGKVLSKKHPSNDSLYYFVYLDSNYRIDSEVTMNIVLHQSVVSTFHEYDDSVFTILEYFKGQLSSVDSIIFNDSGRVLKQYRNSSIYGIDTCKTYADTCFCYRGSNNYYKYVVVGDRMVYDYRYIDFRPYITKYYWSLNTPAASRNRIKKRIDKSSGLYLINGKIVDLRKRTSNRNDVIKK